MSLGQDSFFGTAGTDLASHAPTAISGDAATGVGSWSYPSWSSGAAIVLDAANRARGNAGGVTSVAYFGVAPATTEYDVEADLVVLSTTASYGQVASHVSSSADSYYTIAYGPGILYFLRRESGGTTVVGQISIALPNGTYHAKIATRLSGSDLVVSCYLTRASDGFYLTSAGAWQSGLAAFASLTDTAPLARGYGGIAFYGSSGDSTGPHVDNFLATDQGAATTWPVTDSHVAWSPGNWYSDGGGAFGANNVKASSTYALANTPGAYLKTVVNSGGSGSVSLLLDTAILSGITPANCPTIAYSIDGADFARSLLAYSSSPVNLPLATGLASGLHTVEVVFAAVDLSSGNSMGDRWTDPSTGFSGVKVTGLQTDTGSTLSAPVTRSLRAIWFGDSSLETAQILSSSLAVAGQDATQSYGLLAAHGLDAEVGLVGFAAQGFSQGGTGNTPALVGGSVGVSAWSLYFAGASRLGQPLDLLICSHGINGTTTSSAVQAWLAQARAAYPSAKLVVVVPWSQTSASAIAAGFAAYQLATPDATAFLVNSGIALNVPRNYASGATIYHPNVRGHALIGATDAGLIGAALGGGTVTDQDKQDIADLVLAGIPSVTLDGGTVSASHNGSSPYTITATGLLGATGQYGGKRVYLHFADGSHLLTDACTAHAVTGGSHLFTFAAAQNRAPASGDTLSVTA